MIDSPEKSPWVSRVTGVKRNKSKPSVMKIIITTVHLQNADILSWLSVTLYGVSRCRFYFIVFLIDEVYKRS